MTINTKMIVGLAAGMWLATGTVLAGGDNLRARFVKGSESFFIRTINTTRTTSIDEDSGSSETQDSIEMGMRFRVLDAKTDGSALLECTVLFVDLAFIEGGRVTGYDSRARRSTGRPGWKDRLIALVNKPVMIHLDASGRVTKLDSPSTDNDGRRQHIRFEALISDSVLRQLPLFATVGAPSPIVPQASWKQSFTTDLALSTTRMRVNSEFTVAELKDSSARVSWTSSFRSEELSPSQFSDDLMRVEIREGSGGGVLTWNLADGILQSSQSESRIKMANYMPGAPDLPLLVDRSSSEIFKRVTLADFKMPVPFKLKPKTKPKTEPKTESTPESKVEPKDEGAAASPNSDTEPTSGTSEKADTGPSSGTASDTDKSPG